VVFALKEKKIILQIKSQAKQMQKIADDYVYDLLYSL